MNDFATEIIELNNASSASPELSYKPIYIVTDKRRVDPSKTTLKYLQVGGPEASDKIGNALGAIFKVEFVSVLGITADFIKIWGIHNDDTSAVIYPKTYLDGKTLNVVLNKFEFTDSNGNPVAGGNYTIMGHRKNTQPLL
jgi:hypothetical protein